MTPLFCEIKIDQGLRIANKLFMLATVIYHNFILHYFLVLVFWKGWKVQERSSSNYLDIELRTPSSFKPKVIESPKISRTCNF